MNYFWTNTIWFLLLGICTIVELIIILVKTNQRKFTIAFYLSVTGMVFSFEAIICCFLKAYNYYPMLIKWSQFHDTIAGNLFSQFSVAATALLIPVFRLSFLWCLIIGLLYGIIEEFFLHLDIFKHNWWSTGYTIVGIVLLCSIVRRVYHESRNFITPFTRYIYTFFGIYSLQMPIVVWAFRLTGIQNFNEHILADPGSSYALLALIHLVILSNLIMSTYFAKLNWKWHLPIIISVYAGYYFLAKFDLIIIKQGWFWGFSSISIFSMYFFVFILDYLYRDVTAFY